MSCSKFCSKFCSCCTSKSDDSTPPYPKSIFFIVTTEFCERFNYYGMRAILSLYLRDILLFPENQAIIIFHTFAMLVYFFPLFGAIISDSYWGKFKTIFILSIVYACGNCVLAAASSDAFDLGQIPFSMLGLGLIAIGTGGIKPCVSAFGGDQFVLPEQEAQLARFFSLFYFAINLGSLMSTSITPVLRERVKCFDRDTCYSLAFSVPAILMVSAVVIFILGKPLYKIVKPEENVIVNVSRCIGYGIKQKCKAKEKVPHWLDRAKDKYDEPLVEDVKTTLSVLWLFIPLTVFWALFDQQASGWTFQATHMNGDIGFYIILPDQMQVINPLLILVFIPMFSYGVYPLLAKCNIIKTPLQKMLAGGVLTSIAFVMTAFVSFALEDTFPDLPTNGQCQVRVYNPTECVVTLNATPYVDSLELKPMAYHKILYEELEEADSCNWTLTVCDKTLSGDDFKVEPNQAFYYYANDGELKGGKDDIDKAKNGYPKVRVMTNIGKPNDYRFKSPRNEFRLHDSEYQAMAPGLYTLEDTETDYNIVMGGVYTMLMALDGNKTIKASKLIEVTPPNSVHMLWLLPQYVTITAGEIMLSITGLEFSYSQAPISMKSVVTASFLLTTAMGNLLVVIIESAEFFHKSSHNFLLYAGLMLVDMIIFGLLTRRYKYVNTSE